MYAYVFAKVCTHIYVYADVGVGTNGVKKIY